MKRFKFKKVRISNKGINIEINLERFEKQFQRAQYYLDGQVMTDMVPYMPHRNGIFINLTRARSASAQGSGKVYAAFGPSGRFLYEGKVMVDPVTNSPWARKGAKKVVTERELKYGNPKAQPRWFEVAKKRHKRQWVKEVKNIAGGK